MHWLRIHGGRDSVEPYAIETVYERNHAFDDFFRHEKVQVEETYTLSNDVVNFGPDGKKR